MRSGTGLEATARPTWALVLLAWTLLSGAALAAPDEALLGKAEGYPVCRLDDANIDVIRNRLETYERESKPVLDYYGKKVLHPINADQTPAKVLFDILRHLVKL